jgi:hypothetical protein
MSTHRQHFSYARYSMAHNRHHLKLDRYSLAVDQSTSHVEDKVTAAIAIYHTFSDQENVEYEKFSDKKGLQ